MARARTRPGGVLVVEGHLRENGGLRVSHDVVRILPRHGTPASLFVVQRVDDGSSLLQLDPQVRVHFGSDRPRRLRSLLPVALIRLVAASRRADVVLAGSEIGWGLILGWIAARLTRRPVAVLVQGSLSHAMQEWLSPPERMMTRWIHRHVDRALCVSAGLVDEVAANGLDRRRIAVVAVGIDVKAVTDAADAPGGPPPPQAPYLIAAGRLTPLKGFDVLLRALALAGGQMGAHKLVIYGEGPERPALETLVAELGLGERVTLPGFCSNLHPALAGADAFVLSSRSEGMGGLVLLEAMAHGVPIIATDCVSGPRELLQDGLIGRLVPIDDPAQLAIALADHVGDPTLLRDRARGGPARAADFGADGWVVDLLEALAPVMPVSGTGPTTGPQVVGGARV